MSSKRQTTEDFKKILVAVDGSEYAQAACRKAVVLAKKIGSELVILSVIVKVADPAVYSSLTPLLKPDEGYHQSLLKAAKSHVAKAAALAEREGVKPKTEVQEVIGSAVEGITVYAENENVDLIVVGTRGLGGFKRLLLGSVSSGVVSHAHCTVMVVRSRHLQS